MELPASVRVIWWIGVVVAYLAVPVLLILLLHIFRAARKIEHYAKTSRASTLAITKHLETIAALGTTEERLKGANALMGEVAGGAEALKDLLAKRSGL
jgi:hypothetical protein